MVLELIKQGHPEAERKVRVALSRLRRCCDVQANPAGRVHDSWPGQLN